MDTMQPDIRAIQACREIRDQIQPGVEAVVRHHHQVMHLDLAYLTTLPSFAVGLCEILLGDFETKPEKMKIMNSYI